MGRGLLLWLIGIPIPIILLIWLRAARLSVPSKCVANAPQDL
jgi:hypothetical protein